MNLLTTILVTGSSRNTLSILILNFKTFVYKNLYQNDTQNNTANISHHLVCIKSEAQSIKTVIDGSVSLLGKSETIVGITFTKRTTTAITANINTIIGYVIAFLIFHLIF
ncbi:MAG: hypothetical protein ACOZBL_01005 [Patescibacteria group bacterium]